MKTQVLVQLPTEPSYWGSEVTESDVSRICDRLESMIRSEFCARIDLSFERTQTPRDGGVHSIHEDSAQHIWSWIANNWTAAL
jgi:hypothetical protein